MKESVSRWKAGLSRTSKARFGQIASVFGATEIDADTWDDLEALLIQADIGIETTNEIINILQQNVAREGIRKTAHLQELIKYQLLEHLDIPPVVEMAETPCVILLVGVNGSGKTTTLAKLANFFKENGKSVLIAAADTYRAAAVDQIQIWAERLNTPVIAGQQGGDSGAVVFDAVSAAINRRSDIVLVDTAGRLHTRFNLMKELEKVYRVAGKAKHGAPHEVWLVLDATTGQNALQQAKSFKEAVKVTGVILAKLDSSAKGGMAFAIQSELGIPILFAGLGENVNDLQPFDPRLFIDGILASWNGV
jgi:fused signal recognition particle receptor